MNCHYFLPEIRLPRIEVDIIDIHNNYDDSSYIPGLSNIKAIPDALFGIACLVGAVVASVFSLFLMPFAVLVDLKSGDPLFGQKHYQSELPPLSTFFGEIIIKSAETSMLGISRIVRAAIESIPLAGNLTLAFWDGKIRIIP